MAAMLCGDQVLVCAPGRRGNRAGNRGADNCDSESGSLTLITNGWTDGQMDGRIVIRRAGNRGDESGSLTLVTDGRIDGQTNERTSELIYTIIMIIELRTTKICDILKTILKTSQSIFKD
jgi:hypothetical protein